jgi:hypothetical protein
MLLQAVYCRLNSWGMNIVSTKNKKARLHTEDEPVMLSSGKTIFSNPAIRVILSLDDRGPVALRPRISPGLPFSKSNLFIYKA